MVGKRGFHGRKKRTFWGQKQLGKRQFAPCSTRRKIENSMVFPCRNNEKWETCDMFLPELSRKMAFLTVGENVEEIAIYELFVHRYLRKNNDFWRNPWLVDANFHWPDVTWRDLMWFVVTWCGLMWPSHQKWPEVTGSCHRSPIHSMCSYS